MRSSIKGVTESFDEPAILQIVDEADHRVAVNRHGVGELLLRLSVGR